MHGTDGVLPKRIVPGESLSEMRNGGMEKRKFGLGGASFSNGPDRVPRKSDRTKMDAKSPQTFAEHQHDQPKWQYIERSHDKPMRDSLHNLTSSSFRESAEKRAHAKQRKRNRERESLELERCLSVERLSARASEGPVEVTWEEQKTQNDRAVAAARAKQQQRRSSPKTSPIAGKSKRNRKADKSAEQQEVVEAKREEACPRRSKRTRGESSVASTPAEMKRRTKKRNEGATADRPVVIDDDDVEDAANRAQTEKPRRERGPKDDEVVLQYPPGVAAVDAVALTAGDVERLEPQEFLNDNIVDFFLKLETVDADLSMLLSPSLTPTRLRDQVHVFSSHFYTKLHEDRIANRKADQEKAYDRVERWTRGIDIFTFDFVLVPIVEHLHWSLAVLCHPSRLIDGDDACRGRRKPASAVTDLTGDDDDDQPVPCIIFLDSLKMHKPSTVSFNLRTWLALEADKHSKRVDPGLRDKRTGVAFATNALPLVSPAVPLQTNGWDCGVFLLRYARELLLRCLARPGHEPLRITKARVASEFKHDNFKAWFTPADIHELRLHIKQRINLLIDRQVSASPEPRSPRGADNDDTTVVDEGPG